MRLPTFAAAALATAALSLCAVASAAPDTPAGSGAGAGAADASDMVTVQTISRMAHRMPAADAVTLAGTYPLSNGEILRVSYERSRLYAEMGQRRTELVQTGSTSFVGRGTATQFTFDQVPFATDVVVTGR